jgi:hypothetical protein
MQKTPMQKATETLNALGRKELESLAMAYLESQLLVSRLASAEPPKQITQELVGDRVAALSDADLILLLMPISALGHSD